MSNPLTNPDLAPTASHQRTWSMWNIAALWIGMAVCVPTYMLASSMIAAGMAWWQAVMTVLLGNLIVLVPMILIGHAGTKYGVPFPVFVRSSFGIGGAHVPSLLRALVACGWFGIQTWIGGAAIYQILGAVGWFNLEQDIDKIGVLGITARQFVCFIVFWLMNLMIVVSGINSIKWVEAWAAPFLIVSGLALLMWAIVRVGDIRALFASQSKFQTAGDFWREFIPSLTAMVGFWATLSLNIPDFTRYCKSQRDQAMGQLIGLPTTMTLFAFIGIGVTSATVILFGRAIWDPVELVPKFDSTLVVIIALIALTVATLSTNIAANVVSPANGFANVAPRYIGFRAGGLITCIIGVLIMPWHLLQSSGGYIFIWLIGYSALLGPIAGIMLCDYFVLRRTRLDREALYAQDGPYRGINWSAIVALVVATLPNIPGFLNAAGASNAKGQPIFPSFFDALYGYAWFIGLGLAMIVYFILMVGRVGPAAVEKTT